MNRCPYCDPRYKCHCAPSNDDTIADLREQVAALTEERDALSFERIDLQARLAVERNRADRLQAERDALRAALGEARSDMGEVIGRARLGVGVWLLARKAQDGIGRVLAALSQSAAEKGGEPDWEGMVGREMRGEKGGGE